MNLNCVSKAAPGLGETTLTYLPTGPRLTGPPSTLGVASSPQIHAPLSHSHVAGDGSRYSMRNSPRHPHDLLSSVPFPTPAG